MQALRRNIIFKLIILQKHYTEREQEKNQLIKSTEASQIVSDMLP